MSSKILEVLEDVEFRYPEDPRCSYSIPAGLTLSTGEAWCIYGISGSGKSTLMTLLAALRRLRQGAVRYRFGEGIVDVRPANWDRTVGPAFWRNIGFAFQRPELIRALSVTDNLRLALGNGTPAASDLFPDFEWKKIARSPVWKISGGQTQRLGLLRAFGQGQKLIFLDEPTNNLDRRNRGAVAEFVMRHRESHALLVVSHDDDFIRTLEVDRKFDVSESSTAGGEIRRTLHADLPGRAEEGPKEPDDLRPTGLAEAS